MDICYHLVDYVMGIGDVYKKMFNLKRKDLPRL